MGVQIAKVVDSLRDTPRTTSDRPGGTPQARLRLFRGQISATQISDKPDETVPTPCVKDGAATPMRVWFLSINLVPGNSGSPIFYAPEGANGASFGGGRPFLLGLQSSSFLGADISGMTPVQYIFEAIQNLKLQDADLYRGLIQNKPKTN